MARRVELEKNVPNTPIDDIEDIKWSLKCTNAYVKAVAANMKNLELRMDSFEEGMSVIQNLTEEMSKLKKFVINKEKIEEDAEIPCLLRK